MRLRETFDSDNNTPKALRVERRHHARGVYRPECERDDFHLDMPVDDARFHDSTGTKVLFYRGIMDECPKYKRYGNCVSVLKTRTNPAANFTLLGSSYEESVGDAGPGDCGALDFATSSTDSKVSITVSGGDFSLLPYFAPSVHTSSLLRFSAWSGSDLRKSLQKQAFTEWVPSLEQGLNLTVFFLEFSDTRKLFLSAIKAFKELMTNVFFRKFAARMASRPLKEASNMWLGNTFGVVPLLRDIRTSIEKAISAKEDIERLFADAGKRRTLHWSTNVPHSALDGLVADSRLSQSVAYRSMTSSSRSSPLHYAADLISSIDVTCKLNPEIRRLRYTATCDHAYHLGYMGPFPTMMAAFDQFGIRLSAEDIWEKVPFSFVIDWFVDVGKILEPFRVENVPISVEIHDFCDSILFDYSIEAVAEDPVPYPPNAEWGTDPPWEWKLVTTHGALCERFSERTYYRLRDLPDLSDLREGVTWRLPNTGWHLITSGALLRNRWR